jgi:hypothetical protein
MIGRLTLFESPDILAKTWKLDADGNPQKEVAAKLYRGTYSVRAFETADDLAALLDGLTTRQAISSSLPRDGSTEGSITTKRAGEKGAKVRGKSEFGLMPKPGLLFIDHDAADESAGMCRDELLFELMKALPSLSAAGVVWKPSGSSHVYKGDEDWTGLRGQHFYVMLADASKGADVIKYLEAKFWLAGFGRIHISKAGSMLVRCPIDTAPTDAARLIFAGGAHCGVGLEQRRGPAVILNSGGFLEV